MSNRRSNDIAVDEKLLSEGNLLDEPELMQVDEWSKANFAGETDDVIHLEEEDLWAY